ncbi:uncharacterized protein LOC143217200 [Lasioglossum baleicum]|uniref:uncharacterized protein LOC143217200 n=1 Tax=Lasioglossum baleicum TaxID=434251 RepID=UPI003FCC751E
MSNILDSCGKEPSKPLGDAGTSSCKQSSRSRSIAKENSEVGPSCRKRSRVIDTNDVVSKRLRKEEDSELRGGLQDESRQDLPDQLCNPCQTNRYGNQFPHRLIGLMYQLDLLILCLCRKFTHKRKYPSLSLAFQNSEIDKFSNIVLRYKEKSIHIQVENVDNYINNNINYARLFNKERRSSSINSYFDSFVKHVISKSDSLYNVECLTVYTNSGLDLTEEKELKQGRSKDFYPFKFCSINVEAFDILKSFLFTSNNIQRHGFYQFSRDKTTREELLKRLKFSPAVQRVIKKRELPQGFEKEIKEAFLDKLVFAVNQPNREELNSIIKSEMKRNSEVQDNYNYIALQERILSNLEEDKKLGNYTSGIIYEFNLLMLFLHDMFLHKNMFSINFEGKNTSIDITINYKDNRIIRFLSISFLLYLLKNQGKI